MTAYLSSKPKLTRTASSLLAPVLIGACAIAQAQDLELAFDGDAGPGEIFVKDGGTAPTFTAGRSGRAIVFGDGNVVAVPFDIDARRHPQVTVSMWLKGAADAATQAFLFGPGDGNNQPFLQIVGGRRVAVYGRYADGSSGRLESDASLPIDAWVQVAAVWEYDERTIRLRVGSAVKLFENLEMDVAGGDVGAQRLWTAPNAPDGSQSQPYLFIGARNFRYAFPARGVAVDDVRVFTRALSESEVAALGAESPRSTDTSEFLSGGTEPSELMCSTHAECSTGSYCAFDHTCHPDSHRPLVPLTLTEVPATTDLTPIELEASSLSVRWRPVDSSLDPVSCADAGADRVSVLVTAASSRPPVDMVLDCDLASTTIEPLPLGDYTVAVALLPSGSEQAIATASRSISLADADIPYILTMSIPTPDTSTVSSTTAEPPAAARPVGENHYKPVLGQTGDFEDVIELPDEFATEIAIGVYPSCRVRLNDTEMDLCGSRNSGSLLDVALPSANISRIAACFASTGVKEIMGLYVWGDTTRADGSYWVQMDSGTMPNTCPDEPSESLLCAANEAMTGLVLHSVEIDNGNREFVGLQMICRSYGR